MHDGFSDFLDVTLPLAQNVSLIGFFIVAHAFVLSRWRSRIGWVADLSGGAIFGLCAILLIAAPVSLSEGFFLDGRYVVIVIATVFGGPIAGLITSLLAAAARYTSGGIGVLPALAAIVATYGLAIVYRRGVMTGWWATTGVTLLGFGLVVALFRMLCYLLLPEIDQAIALLWLAVVPTIIANAGGVALLGLFAQWLDSRAALGAALREANTRLQAAITGMDGGFRLFDAQDRLVVSSQGFTDENTFEKFGDPIGRTFEDLMRAFAYSGMTAVAALPDREAWLRWRLERHRNPPAEPFEMEWTDGRWIRMTERRTPEGETVGVWADITDQKARQAELQRAHDSLRDQAEKLRALTVEMEGARQAAVAASQEKSQFLASMSHELRSPLNAINGFSEVMRKELFGPIQPVGYRDYAAMINDSGQHLLSLINDILDLSKIEAGKMELRIECVSPQDMLRRAIGLTGGLAGAKKIVIGTREGPDCTIMHADDRAATQMVINLLSNAIKFTPENGEIEVALTASGEAGMSIAVSDTGIGMSATDIETALRAYGQVSSGFARTTTGTGLGLTLVKAMIELHGGSLEVRSVMGKGSTFLLHFPWHPELAR